MSRCVFTVRQFGSYRGWPMTRRSRCSSSVRTHGAAASRLTSEEIDLVGRDLRLTGGHTAGDRVAAVRVPALGVAQVARVGGGPTRISLARQSARLAPTPDVAGGPRLELRAAGPRRTAPVRRAWPCSPAGGASTPRVMCVDGARCRRAPAPRRSGGPCRQVACAGRDHGRAAALPLPRDHPRIRRGPTCWHPTTTKVTRARHASYFRANRRGGSGDAAGYSLPGRHGRSSPGARQHAQRAALVAGKGQFEEGLGLCQALSGFWLSQGFLSEGEGWLERFLARSAGGVSVGVGRGPSRLGSARRVRRSTGSCA